MSTPTSGGPANGEAGSAPSTTAGVTPPVATAGTGAPSVTPGAAGGEAVQEEPVQTPPPASVSEWRMMGYDLANTFNNTAEKTLTKENAAKLVEAYTVDMGGNVYGAPLQIGDTIYASAPNMVRALKAASGETLWELPKGTLGSLSFADGRLYMQSIGGRITAISAEGEELWVQQSDMQSSDGSSSPTIAGDLLLTGGSGGGDEITGGDFRGFVTAKNPLTGAQAWTTYTVDSDANGASIWSTVSVDLDAGRVYAGTGNNYGSPATDTSDAFVAFDLKSGEIVWKYQAVAGDTYSSVGDPFGPDSDFGANVVLFEAMLGEAPTKLASSGNKAGDAFAVRRDTGALVWKRTLCMGGVTGEQGIFVNASWTGKNMLFACNEGAGSSPGASTLYALDGATGDIAWMRKLDGRVWGRISIANGVGFTGIGTTLEVFDVDTGATIKNFPSKGGTVAGTVSIANGRVAWGEGMTWMRSNRAGSTLHVLAIP